MGKKEKPQLNTMENRKPVKTYHTDSLCFFRSTEVLPFWRQVSLKFLDNFLISFLGGGLGFGNMDRWIDGQMPLQLLWFQGKVTVVSPFLPDFKSVLVGTKQPKYSWLPILIFQHHPSNSRYSTHSLFGLTFNHSKTFLK